MEMNDRKKATIQAEIDRLETLNSQVGLTGMKPEDRLAYGRLNNLRSQIGVKHQPVLLTDKELRERYEHDDRMQNNFATVDDYIAAYRNQHS